MDTILSLVFIPAIAVLLIAGIASLAGIYSTDKLAGGVLTHSSFILLL